MALLNTGMEDMQPMDMPSQRMVSSSPEQSVLERILGGIGTVAKYALPGLAIPAMAIKDAYSSRDSAKQSMQDMQGMSYQQLAEYWAQQGDPVKAKQYAELAGSGQPKAREVFSRTEGVVDDQGQTGVLLTYRNGEQEFKPVQYAPNAAPAGRAAATPRVPVGMMWNPETGRAEQIPGVPVKAAPAGRVASASARSPQQVIEPMVTPGLTPTPRGKITTEQRSTLGYTDRMLQAEQALSQINNGAPTAKTSAIGAIPLIGDYAQRLSQTPSQQLFDNASTEWIRAKLRKESGAAIGNDEMQQEFNTYFPKPGDGPDVIKQKAQLRQNAMASMARQAGSSLPASSGARNQPMKSLPPASQYPGAVIKDTKFGKRFKSNGKTWEPI